MPSSRPSSFKRSRRSSLDAVGKDARPGPLGHLDRRDAHAACARVDQRGFAGLQSAEFEEAVVGGAEGDRDACRLIRPQAVGDAPGERLGHGAQLGVRAVEADRDDTIALGEAMDPVAQPDDRAGALVADDVGDACEVTAETVQRVPALDADCLDPDQEVAGTGLRVRHVLVTEHVGRPRLVVHRSFHERTYFRIREPRALGVPA